MAIIGGNLHRAENSEIDRKLKDRSQTPIACPSTIQVYNYIMGGVDMFDQLEETYMIRRRSKKWWHPIMYYYIDMAAVNSYIMYRCYKGSDCQDQLLLASQLIGDNYSRKRSRDSRCNTYLLFSYHK